MNETKKEMCVRLNLVVKSMVKDIEHMPMQDQMTVGVMLLASLLKTHTDFDPACIQLAKNQLDLAAVMMP